MLQKMSSLVLRRSSSRRNQIPEGMSTATESADSFANKFLKIELELEKNVSALSFKSKGITHIYSPLDYAWETHSDFIRKYIGETKKKILFIGMNPGPFGMAQNGVPFGETDIVNGWLKIEGQVKRPVNIHPKRPIEGLLCQQHEVSGTRLWKLIRELSKDDPRNFFHHSFLYNYCPLAFMTSSGANVTPPQLKVSEKKVLYEHCDVALAKIVTLLEPKAIVGIGKFAQERAQATLDVHLQGVKIEIHYMSHPSPLNATANKNGGWDKTALEQLNAAGLLKDLQSSF